MLLREYQKAALAEIKRLYREEDVRRLILSMPTGLGKTVIFTHLHEALDFRKDVLVIAHRQELIKQAVEQFGKTGYNFKEEHIDDWYRNVGNRNNGSNQKVWIATVQSLTHPMSRRLRKLPPPDQFDLVICDEAHHSVASSYLSVCDHFGISDNRFKGLFLGVTATPIRHDGKSLGQIFDRIVSSMDTFTAIQEGWLVAIKYFQAHSRVTLSTESRGQSNDFNLEALGRIINKDIRNSLIYKAWKERADGKSTVVFCATVQHAANIAKTFEQQGVRAGFIDGSLPQKIREKILKQHKDGKLVS